MSSVYLYISGTDANVNQSFDVADAYLYVNPAPTSDSDKENYYTNVANGSTLVPNPSADPGLQQTFSGTTFSDNLSSPLIFKRSTNLTFSDIYSEFSTFVFNLSGIEDEKNNIIRTEFQPNNGKILSHTYDPNPIEEAVTGEFVYSLAIGKNVNQVNPKNQSFSTSYNLNSLTTSQYLSTFNPRISAFRQDGLVDEYNINVTVSKDSVLNLANKINLISSQVLPITSLDPMIKLELENPNYVNNAVIRRAVTQTPTPTRTKSNATPTPSRTATQTRTRTQTVTRTMTKSQTQTPTRTNTQTRTRTQTQTQQATSTRTPTQTKTRTSTKLPQFPTPTPSPSKNTCYSQQIRVNFTGINDKVEQGTIGIVLSYKHDEANRAASTVMKKPLNTFGTYDLDFYVNTSLTALNKFKASVIFTKEDPGITINSITRISNCKAVKPDVSDELPKPIPNPVPTPTKSAIVVPEKPAPKNLKNITFVYYLGAQNIDQNPDFPNSCTRNFTLRWEVRNGSKGYDESNFVANGIFGPVTLETPQYRNGEYVTGQFPSKAAVGNPVKITVPYDPANIDPEYFTGAEVLDGNWYLRVHITASALSNNCNFMAQVIDPDGHIVCDPETGLGGSYIENDPVCALPDGWGGTYYVADPEYGFNEEVDTKQVGPCMFGDLDYTHTYIFAGPDQQKNIPVLPYYPGQEGTPGSWDGKSFTYTQVSS